LPREYGRNGSSYGSNSSENSNSQNYLIHFFLCAVYALVHRVITSSVKPQEGLTYLDQTIMSDFLNAGAECWPYDPGFRLSPE